MESLTWMPRNHLPPLNLSELPSTSTGLLRLAAERVYEGKRQLDVFYKACTAPELADGILRSQSFDRAIFENIRGKIRNILYRKKKGWLDSFDVRASQIRNRLRALHKEIMAACLHDKTDTYQNHFSGYMRNVKYMFGDFWFHFLYDENNVRRFKSTFKPDMIASLAFNDEGQVKYLPEMQRIQDRLRENVLKELSD